MRTETWITSIAAIVFVCVPYAGAAEQSSFPLSHGQWSRDARYLWPGPTAIADAPENTRAIRITDASGASTLSIDDYSATLARQLPDRVTQTKFEIESLAESLWSPDGKALVITQSDGGWVGTWSVSVFVLEGSTWRHKDVSASLQADFRKAMRLPKSEFPNFGAVAWLDGGAKLIVAGEVPCHSSVRNMCQVRGYVIEIRDSKVLERLECKELLQRAGVATGERIKCE